MILAICFFSSGEVSPRIVQTPLLHKGVSFIWLSITKYCPFSGNTRGKDGCQSPPLKATTCWLGCHEQLSLLWKPAVIHAMDWMAWGTWLGQHSWVTPVTLAIFSLCWRGWLAVPSAMYVGSAQGDHSRQGKTISDIWGKLVLWVQPETPV